MARIPIAVQLYSVRDDCAKDLPGVLEAVADMGYDGVEFAGYHGKSAKELRKMLDDLGLQAAGTHLGLSTLLGDELARTVEFNRILGNRFLIVPGLPEERCNSKKAWKQTAKLFSDLAAKVEPEGMFVGYHNHSIEFAPLEGELPWDTFFSNADPRVVMQLDTGNALHGGGDPVPYVERYPGRALTVHLKEYSKTKKDALIGEGDTDWQRLFDLCESIGDTEWYVVEQETYAFPPMECIAKCLENLEEMGK